MGFKPDTRKPEGLTEGRESPDLVYMQATSQ
jgi:hypothetical protein